MSFGWSAATWFAISAAATTAVGVYTADQQRSASNKATDANKANALKTQAEATRANNRANAKTPDTAALMAANMAAGKAGNSGTMLTGPAGVDPSLLTLGKNTLLGS